MKSNKIDLKFNFSLTFSRTKELKVFFGAAANFNEKIDCVIVQKN